MLAKHLMPLLLRSVLPSYAPAFGPIDHRRLRAPASTCFKTVAREGSTQAAPHLWSTTYANPVARAKLALREQHKPDTPVTALALTTLAQGAALLLAWHAP
jgi:hypothetical protein